MSMEGGDLHIPDKEELLPRIKTYFDSLRYNPDKRRWFEVNWPLVIMEFVMGIHPMAILNATMALVVFVSLIGILKRTKIFHGIMEGIIWRLVGVTIIRQEAMMQHSPLEPDMVPGFQIRLCKPKALGSLEHVGFCLRVAENIVALPTHVYQCFQPGEKVVMVGKKSSLMVQMPMSIHSVICSDLTYIQMPTNWFIDMGVSVGKLAMFERSQMVNCTGFKDGRVVGSQGIITFAANSHYMLRYSGSTIAGFSGAAYFNGNQIYGMHTGSLVLGSCNLGIDSGVLIEELIDISTKEVTPPGARDRADDLVSQMVSNTVQYRRKAFRQALDRQRQGLSAFSTGDWAAEIDDENLSRPFQKLSVGAKKVLGDLTSLSEDEAKAIIRLIAGESMLGQGEIETVVDVEPVPVTYRLDILEEKVAKLENKQKELITKLSVDSNTVVQPRSNGQTVSEKTIQCTGCNRWFKTKKFMAIHRLAVHSQNEESAYPQDYKKQVRTAPFLEKSMKKESLLSPKKNSPSLPKASSSLEPEKVSSVKVDNPLKTEDYQKKLDVVLENIRKVMDGLSSLQGQN